MKRLLFSPILIGTGLTFMLSCNSGTSTTEETSSDSTMAEDTAAAMAPAPPAPASTSENVVLIKTRIKSYEKWLPYYESHDSLRDANGLEKYVIARGTKDSNMLFVVMKMVDTTKAKAMISSPEMRARMKESGVIGAPEIDYVTTVMDDNSPIQSNDRLIVKHQVKDWDAWKKSFDDHKQARMDNGLMDRAVGYEMGNNHKVLVAFAITDAKKAEDFSKSKDLKAKMDSAGVVGAPSFFYYTIVKKY